MANNRAAALRAARQERLATKQAAPQGPQSHYSFKAKEAQPAPSTETKPVEVPKDLVAPVLDPSAVSKTATFDMSLFGDESKDPHWMLTADGRPVAEIRLSDQEDAEKIAKVFVTPQYAHGIIESAKQLDLADLLKGVKARPYVAAVQGADAYKSMQQTVTASAEETLRKAKANLRGDMLNVLGLVVTAQSKNFIVENGLKDGLFNRMKAAGIEDDRAVAVIEAAWQEKAPEYFEECFKQAAKWMDLTPEAYAELQEQIVGMPARMPTVEASDSIRHAGATPRVPSEQGNVPFTTHTAGSAEPVASEKDQLKAALGFRSRHVHKQM